MTHVLTLIAGKDRELTDNHLKTVKNLSYPSSINWLAPKKAADLFFENDQICTHKAELRIGLDQENIDFVLQPADDARRKELLCADMDSTLIEQECLDELAAHIGIGDQISEITERAMRGELDFNTSLTERMALLKNTPVSALSDVSEKLTLTEGALELVKTMSAHGASCILVSGGFTFFADPIAERLGCIRAYSNHFEIVEEQLTGHVTPPIVDSARKKEIFEMEQKNTGLNRTLTMAVGDGANDIPMITSAGLGVAFRAKPKTENAAPHRIRHGDLSSLLYVQGYTDENIITE